MRIDSNWIASFALFLHFLRVSHAQSVPALFVFGDSLVDVGNNNFLPFSIAKADFPHNGIDFPTKQPTGRFSNGKNVADLLADKVGLPSPPPYLSLSLSQNATVFSRGVSFASGGSGIFNSTDEILGQSIPLTEQVSKFQLVYQKAAAEMGATGARQLMSSALFFVVVGSNDLYDYSRSSDLRKQYTSPQFSNALVSALENHIKELYKYGATKFSFVGISLVGCTPSRRVKNDDETCDKALNSMAVVYNRRLRVSLIKLKRELKGFSYSYFDAYSKLSRIFRNPASFGFREIKAACCGLGKLRAEIPCLPVSDLCENRTDHLFWDPYHPSQAAVTLIANDIFDGPPELVYPTNLRKLLAT